MRKPRDYDAELKALDDKARQLKVRKLQQLGELVIATGADMLPVELLAGALIDVAENKDGTAREGWRKRGAAFFQGKGRDAARGTHSRTGSASPRDSGAQSADGDTSTR